MAVGSKMNKKFVLRILAVIAFVLLLMHLKPTNDANSPSGSTSLGAPTNSSLREQKPATFDGDPCTSDCSGHEAGYNWAESHALTDEDDCDTAGENSNSPSFAEGCKAYVRGDDPDEDTTDDDSDD